MAKIYDVIVIGGGPAGLTSGIYGGRSKLDVLMIEKDNLGGQISLTDEVVNYPGMKKISGSELMKAMREQAKSFGVSFVQTEVIEVNFSQDIKKIITQSGVYEGRSVIIASGLVHKKLNFKGEEEYRGKGISYCATCDGEFFVDRDIFVIGAGFAACQEALFLTRYGKKVHIIAREPEFTCARSIADKVLTNPKIEVSFNSEVLEVSGDSLARKIKTKNNITGEVVEYSSEDGENIGVFVFVGQEPKTALYKGKIDLDDDGYILTDTRMRTNLDMIYAVGDIRQKYLRQLVTAVADGAIAISDVEKCLYDYKIKNNSNVEIKKEVQIEEKPQGVFSEEMLNLIKETTNKFKEEIELVLVKSEDDEKNKKILEVSEELGKISNKIKFKIYEANDEYLKDKISLVRLPALYLLDKDGKYARIKYSTIPIEYELESFLQAMNNIVGEEEKVRENLLERINKLDKKINVKIGVSLKCTRCPQTVRATQFIVSKNKNIDLEVIDVITHKEFKTKYDIVGVPAIVVNDKNLYFGQMNLEEMIEILEKQ